MRVVRFTQRNREWFLVDPSISDDLFEDNLDARGDMAPLCVASDCDHVARWFFQHHKLETTFTAATYRDLRALHLDHPRTHRCLRDWQRTIVREMNSRHFLGWGSLANVWGGL